MQKSPLQYMFYFSIKGYCLYITLVPPFYCFYFQKAKAKTAKKWQNIVDKKKKKKKRKT